MGIRDLWSVKTHDKDFRSTRAIQLLYRIQALSVIYAVVGTAWYAIDYLTIPAEKFLPLAGIRGCMVLSFIGLALWTWRSQSLTISRLKLVFHLFVPTAFFVLSRIVIDGDSADAAIMVYSFYPFVILAQLAVFPLTITECLGFILLPFTGMILVAFAFENINDLTTVGNLTLALLLSFLASWAAVSQLRMMVHLYRQATRDALTNMPNRRLLLERLKEEEARFRRTGKSMCLMILDLDRFKRVNDTYGHLIGDMVLQRFSEILKDCVRTEDIVGRYGGEEFLMVLPDTETSHAVEVAERIRSACEPASILTQSGQDVRFTVSIGVAKLRAGESGVNALERADMALYRSKEEGRNRIERAD